MTRLYNLLKKNKKTLVYYPLAIYWATLLVLTSLPSVKFIDKFKVSDKVEHLLAYFGLGILFSLSLHFQAKYLKLREKFWQWSIALISIYAALDEIHQLFIPNRQGDVSDWLADFLGVLIASFIVKKFVEMSLTLTDGTFRA